MRIKYNIDRRVFNHRHSYRIWNKCNCLVRFSVLPASIMLLIVFNQSAALALSEVLVYQKLGVAYVDSTHSPFLPPVWEKASDDSTTRILDLADPEARDVMKAMAITGDLHSKLLAGAWVVMSSIATGVGRKNCSLNGDEIIKTIWQPALDGMCPDEIYELNRLVTANFRNSENKGGVDVNKLYPAARQVVLYLNQANHRWDCQKVKDIWMRAEQYIQNKNN